MKLKTNRSGFTLTELIIVVSILAVFSAVSYFSYSQYLKEAENTKKQAEVDKTLTLIEMDMLKNESFSSKAE
jgi:type IV pilus assembly protein PilE